MIDREKSYAQPPLPKQHQDSPGLESRVKPRPKLFGADTALGRPGQPEEIAPVYVFLASNADSSFISGEVITLLGGDVTVA
jgi:NAD(P)-dependent dehydrogenase (short-subunit alcohol dehydrogenase family)